MKKISLKFLLFVGCIAISFIFNSCEDNDDKGNSQNPEVTKVFLEDANSKVPDREVTFARLGQLLRLEGNNFVGVTNVYINGYKAYFNPNFVSNNSMLVQIDNDTPTAEADPDVRNKIKIVKGGDQFTEFTFEIRAAAPSITNISHTMPLTGEWITVEGRGLIEIYKVIFPGGIEVTSDIEEDEDGKFFKVKVPGGVSEDGGSIFMECANGGAYSPAYFNCKKGLILDFDGHGEPAGWTDNAVKSEDFLSDVIGVGNVSQGKYCPLIPDKLAPVKLGTPRATEVWTTGKEDWRKEYVPLFSESTPLEQMAFQFDIYVPETWNNTGFIGICLVNNFSAGNQWTGEFYNYIPWLAGAEKVPFKTLGWTTITIPLNKFYKYAKDPYTFADILAFREEATNKNFGMFFNNNDFTLKNVTGNTADESVEFLSSATSVKVYVDNFRLVSLDTPAYSDFPDEE